MLFLIIMIIVTIASILAIQSLYGKDDGFKKLKGINWSIKIKYDNELQQIHWKDNKTFKNFICIHSNEIRLISREMSKELKKGEIGSLKIEKQFYDRFINYAEESIDLGF